MRKSGNETIDGLAQQYLKKKGSAHLNEIYNYLKNNRPDLRSKDISATVRSVIIRKVDIFEKVKPGVYKLKNQ